MIKPSDFTVSYLKDLTPREHEFVNLFWQFADDVDLDQFTHTISALNIEFSDIKIKKSQSVSKLILDLAYISCPKIICPQCNQTIKFQHRWNLNAVNKRENFLCHTCVDFNLQNELSESFDFIEYFIENVELPESQFNINSLNYIEKIFLLIILDNVNPSGHFSLDIPIVSDEVDQNIIISLSEKGVIFHLHSQIEIVSKLRSYIYNIQKNIDFLNKDQRSRFSISSNKLPEFGFYLLIKQNEVSKESIRNELIESLNKKNTLTVDETKDIERIIRVVLNNRAVKIVKSASKYYNFRSKDDEALGSVLNYATWKYSMRRVCSLIYYSAKDLAANLQARDIHPAVVEHALRKKIENYIAYLDEKPSANAYFKDIPESVSTPKISTFRAVGIFKDVFSWDSLSGREILNHWIKNYCLNSDNQI